jgi:Protein of unknown function (DUF2752)
MLRSYAWMPVRLCWEERDRHRWMGPLAAAGIVAGVLMAVFGLPPVDLHGPLHYAGVMDPLCGGTRGVREVLRGDLREAWAYNPASPVLVVGAAATLVREAVGRARGQWLNPRITRRRTTVLAGLSLLAGLEANQQAHAGLLRTTSDPGVPTGLLVFLAALAVAVGALLVRRRALRS